MIRQLLVIAFILIGLSVFGQTLNEKLSSNKVLIGKPITLTYSVITSKSDTIRFTHESKEIKVRSKNNGSLSSKGSTIEVQTPFSESENFKNGKKIWQGTYEVVVWDSGTFIIPGPQIAIGDSNYYFQDLQVYCDFTQKKSGIDIYEIREKYSKLPPEENPFVLWIKKFWWILALIFGVVILIWYLIKKSKPAEPVRIKKAMSLKERTLTAIDALENEKLWEKNALKQHYIELSYILRSYLTARYDISILEKTTFETKALLLQKGLNDDTVDTIVMILSQSDMVKFAKSTPEAVEILKISTLARQIVAETSPLEFDNYE